ncbi:hypothetical protein [Streptomyces antioxidans]|uniref:hypothetical protein n=1 Tax=Streptomyces TaxID=1883 RepID=UPI00117D9BA9|nr:hypothetical protein [Streptomyces antioxidans]
MPPCAEPDATTTPEGRAHTQWARPSAVPRQVPRLVPPSCALRFRAEGRRLTAEEVAASRDAVVSVAAERTGATLRGA